MSWVTLNFKKTIYSTRKAKTTALLFFVVVFFFASLAGEASAQKRFSKTYPAERNIRLELVNRTGTITVEGWNRNEVEISARLEKPVANIVPQNQSGKIVLNVIKDNQGRGEVGNVNFDIKVPYNSSIDIETRIGNLSVNNVQGGLLRAHISTEGDITLTNIGSSKVSAENLVGNIFYDGLIQPEGIYRFTSMRGDINIRIPFNSSFNLVATAPTTRSISMGSFSGGGLSFVSNGRRVVGKVNDGGASLTVTNQNGAISFIRR